MVAADSYFYSVKYSESLEWMVLGFIVVVKHASFQYPIKNMKNKEFTHRENCYGLGYFDEGRTDMMEFAWVDLNRPYFIAARGSLEEGKDSPRQIWRQVVSDVNSDSQMVDLDIPQTSVTYM